MRPLKKPTWGRRETCGSNRCGLPTWSDRAETLQGGLDQGGESMLRAPCSSHSESRYSCSSSWGSASIACGFGNGHGAAIPGKPVLCL